MVVLKLLIDVKLKLQLYVFIWKEIFRAAISNRKECTSGFSSNSYTGSCLCFLGAQAQFISLDRQCELPGKLFLIRLENIVL